MIAKSAHTFWQSAFLRMYQASALSCSSSGFAVECVVPTAKIFSADRGVLITHGRQRGASPRAAKMNKTGTTKEAKVPGSFAPFWGGLRILHASVCHLPAELFLQLVTVCFGLLSEFE
jgi:hypothetical protein